nr:hypothetical protein 4 [Halieaceae bacterium]
MLSSSFDDICAALSTARERIFLVSAYAKYDATVALLQTISQSTASDRRLYVRWLKSDLMRGASDLRVYEAAKLHGFSVHIHNRLHAKMYIADETIVSGSANLTASGLGLRGTHSNLEYVCSQSSDTITEKWLARLSKECSEVTDELYSLLRRDVLSEPQPMVAQSDSRWSSEVMELIAPKPNHRDLSLYELFWLPDPKDLFVDSDHPLYFEAQHDQLLLDIDGPCSSEILRVKFEASVGWLWLSEEAREIRHFGDLSSTLHAHVADQPNPFRRDVKTALKNLLTWAKHFRPDQCRIERPRHGEWIQIT